MKYVKLFENWNDIASDVEKIADELTAASSGLGTDEAAIVAALSKIKNKEMMIKLNSLLQGSQFEYHTVGEILRGELGLLDQSAKTAIADKLKAVGALDSIDAIPSDKEVKADNIVNQIMNRVIKHEGYKPKVYTDTKGNPTVGVGFNLNRQDSAEKLQEVGASLSAVKSGTQQLSDSQIKELLIADLNKAKEDAKGLVKNFSSLPASVQGVLTEMTFNLGKKGLSEFTNFLANVTSKNFEEASKEMLNSAWAKQVGQRANTLSGIIKTA
jgi:lysozyme